MKILYGLAGEGFGHSSRALTIIPFLQNKGHEIKVLTYGQAYEALKDKFEVRKIQGSHIEFTNEKIDYYKTFVKNLERNLENAKNYKDFHNLMKSFHPDAIISDMEPLTPILSNLYHIPLISLDNQHRITNLRLEVPKEYYKDYLAAKAVVNLFCRAADHYIITSFTPAKITKKNSHIVPPIVRNDVLSLKPSHYGPVLVYLTKENTSTLEELTKINETFIIYGFNKSSSLKNLQFKTKETFLQDLKDCKAILATAGFTLMSEALHLKKPYFALPLNGQFEQTLNALFLKQANFGDFSDNLNSKEIESFLDNLEKYRTNLEKYNPDYSSVFKTLEKTLNKI